ncbi:hypothetical protein P9B03_15800 [Metasolibacillus meyeri]|uniref:Uncharacterized protein n=1 Tax=Metasolibacillus meyeri TaxID=1071052 RepID=A0AAW9NWP7_9BACL|nr:hypothetical protein [Metasolibacillus meyeri]MEC1179964.1 hypothetical protein [Metasolibacillus meyeri]
MSIGLAGYLVSISGLFVVLATIFNILPTTSMTMRVIFIAIGMTFAIGGSVLRFTEYRKERKRVQQ